MSDQPATLSIQINGSRLRRSPVITGDHNTVTFRRGGSRPAGEAIDIAAELIAIRRLLEALDTPDRGKIGRALADADDDANRDEPDRDQVARALDRAIEYASKAQGFAAPLAGIRPHLKNAAAWLGTYGPNLARAISLA